MTKIYISYDESEAAVNRVKVALDEVRDPNFGGAVFEIERADFTSVDCDDVYAGTELLHSVIYPALREAVPEIERADFTDCSDFYQYDE